MVDYHELSTAKIESLGTAAGAWDGVVTKLRAMDQEWDTTVIAKVNNSGWSGDAADASRPKLQRTNEQLTAAVTQATAIASILRDAGNDFQAARNRLNKVVADAKSAGLTVSSDGTVSWPPADQATRHDPDANEDYQRSYRDKAKATREAIDSCVREATEADERAAYALRSDTSTDQLKSFNASAIGGGPEADGKRAAQLAAKGGKISDPELVELNSLLAAGQNDPKFSTKFYNDLGPKGLLESWNGMVGDEKQFNGASDARWKMYQDLQRNLGLNLATATRSTNEPHLSEQWAADLRKAGSETMWNQPRRQGGTDYAPYGYQVLSGILRTGNYDPKFLNPIAEHVTQLDKDDKYWPAPFYGPHSDRRGFNLLGADGGSGFEPTTAILEALGHSPEAATKFFHDTPTAYNTDGTVKPNGKVEPSDYLKYFTQDKDYTPDTVSQKNDLRQAGMKSGPDALGHALEAATTGRPYGDIGAPLKHTPDQAAVMERVVQVFGTHGDGGVLDELKGEDAKLAPLRDSIGHMTADYMGDFQRSLSPHKEDLPTNGFPADLKEVHTRGLLDALGRDPEAYGSIVNANQAYSTAVVRNQIDAGGTDFARLESDIGSTSRAGGVISGILNEARVNEVHQNHATSDKEFNESLERNAGRVEGVFSATIGLATERVPLAGEVSDMIIGEIKDAVVKANEQDTTEDGRQEGRGLVADGRAGAALGAQSAVQDAAINSKLSAEDIRRLADAAGDRALDGYTDGSSGSQSSNGKVNG
ncbi:WXG100 family type VII secretion target [Kitasatospora sp. NPDC004240]